MNRLNNSFRLVRMLPLACATLAVLPTQAFADSGQANAVLQGLRQQGRALEHGEGVAQDYAKAISLYCQGARIGDADAAYDMGWMYANGRGVARDDAMAAALFRFALSKGHEPSRNILRFIRTPPSRLPDCMRNGGDTASAGVIGNLLWEEDLTSSRR